MKRSRLLGAACGLIAALAAGCDWQLRSLSEPGAHDSITLASVVPSAGTKLAPGASVTFTAIVDYEVRSGSVLTGDRGTVTMDIEDQDDHALDVQVRKTVGHGQGSTSLSDRIDVPASGVTKIKVILTLVPEATSAGRVAPVGAFYPVGR